MFNILIFGLGNIGSRHLQGLIKVPFSLNICVIDSSNVSIRNAQSLWNEAGGNKSKHIVEWCSKISQNIKDLDLAIVATSSKNRADIVEQILSVTKVKYWIFEKILAQSIQELDLIKNKTNKSYGLWVNTPRRLMTNYKNFKNLFEKKKNYKIRKIGGLWGLACNSIHYIDLVSWWTGENLISVNTEKLNKNWFKSKRPGYFEVSGELLIKFSKGTELILQSDLNSVENDIKIEQSNNKWIIAESDNFTPKPNVKVLNGKLELQSEMTGPIVTQILSEGICDLPTLKESCEQHAIYLEAMINHWNLSNNCNDVKISIT